MNLVKCDVREATHVLFRDQILEIEEKIGIREDGTVRPPSEGGFAVITTDGQRVSMWQASRYFKERTDGYEI